MIYPFDLQLFAEGGAPAGATAGTGATPQVAAAGNSGVTGTAAASHRSGRQDLSQVQYGKQGPVQQGRGPAPTTTGQTGAAKQDDAARGQQGKTYTDAEVQQIVQARLKDARGHQAAMETLQPMLKAMASQWGIKEDDYQALADRYLSDDSLYEEEAIETGMSVEAVKQLHQLRAERDRAMSQVSQFTEQAQMETHLRGLIQQGEAFKSKYPLFDLQAALQDDAFVRMTSPGGLSVEQAYAALHHDEMQQWAIAQATQQTMRRASQAVQANMARPVENAGRGAAPAAPVRDDPSKLNRDDIKEIMRRAQRGEKISFD